MILSVFTDCRGREWPLRTTGELVARLKAEFGIDPVGDLLKEVSPLYDLADDPARLAEVLWVFCEAQAGEYGVTKSDFLHLLDVPTLRTGWVAILAAGYDVLGPGGGATAESERAFREALDRYWSLLDRRD